MFCVGQCFGLIVDLLVFWQQTLSLDAQTIKTITDRFGNSADEDNNIKFANYSEIAEYELEANAFINAGLLGYYEIARAIARSGFGSSYPYDLVLEVTKGITIKTWGVLFASGSGYAVGLLIGIIIVCIFIFLALSTPCGLCCSSSFNRELHKELPTTKTVTIWGLVIVILVGVFAVAGIGGAYQTVIRATNVVTSFFENAASALADFKTFIAFSAGELLFIFDKFGFTKKVFLRDLDNIGQLMGDSIRQTLSKDTNLDAAIAGIKQYENLTQELEAALGQLENNLSYLDGNVSNDNNTFNAFLNGPVCASAGCLSFALISVPHVNLSRSLALVKHLSSLNLSKSVDNGKSEVDKISRKTVQYSKQQVQDLKANLDAQLNELENFRTVIQDVRDEILRNLDTDKYKNDLMKIAKKFYDGDRIRSDVMQAILGFDLLAMLLMVSGSVLLVVAYRSNLPVIKRNGGEDDCPLPSLVGGKIMYAGIGFFILFGWLWMMYAMVMYAIGAPLDAVFCSVIDDPDFIILDELIEERSLFGPHENGTWLATEVLAIPKSTATVGSVLRDCRDNKTLFVAIQMDKHPMTNFSKIIEFTDKLHVADLLNSVNFPMGKVDLVNPDVKIYLSELQALQDSLPLNQLKGVVNQATASGDALKMYKTHLPASAQSAYPSSLTNNQLQEIVAAIAENVATLEKNHTTLRTAINNSMTSAEDAQGRIPGAVRTAISEGAEKFQTRLDLLVNAFIKEAKNNVYYEYAKCKPLYNILIVLLHGDACGNLANIVNGSWLAVGWLQLFLLLASYLSVHLNRLIPLPGVPSLQPSHENLPVHQETMGKPNEETALSSQNTLGPYPEKIKDDQQKVMEDKQEVEEGQQEDEDGKEVFSDRLSSEIY